MTDLTDMELIAHIEMTHAAIAEMESNLVNLKEDYARYLDELAVRKGASRVEDFYEGKLERLYKFIIDFTCSSMPKKTASYRFVPVPTYRDSSGIPRSDPLEYRIDEENNSHMTITFFVSTDRIRESLIRWWQVKFKNLTWIQFRPDE